jgi:hypothetical protein
LTWTEIIKDSVMATKLFIFKLDFKLLR